MGQIEASFLIMGFLEGGQIKAVVEVLSPCDFSYAWEYAF